MLDVDPLTPHFYIVKLGATGVNSFFHYDNMPIQYTSIFSAVKMKIFSNKSRYFSFFC